MDFETVLLEKKDGVGIITLNRSQYLNTINGQLLEELNKVLSAGEDDADVGALVLTGGAKCFCAGADVKYVNSFKSPNDFTAFSRLTRQTFHNIENFSKPVIAAISGVALGGGLEMALCCDLRIVSESAKLGLPEVKLGAIPGAGGTQRLPRLIGPALAKQIIFTGMHISGAEAYKIGLANQVASTDDFLDEAVKLAVDIAEKAPLALRAAKSCINTGLQIDLESGLNYETQWSVFVVGSEDHVEGFRSFVEKRKPVWKGR